MVFFCPIIQEALSLDICLGSIKVCTLISLPLFDLYLIKSVLGILLITYSAYMSENCIKSLLKTYFEAKSLSRNDLYS